MMQDYMILRKDDAEGQKQEWMIRSSRTLSRNGRAKGGGRTPPEHGGSFVGPVQCPGCDGTGRRRGHVQ